MRIRPIAERSVLILWNDYEYTPSERCIRTYEIYFAPDETHDKNLQWKLITKNKHVPFLSYNYRISTANERFKGVHFDIVRIIDANLNEWTVVLTYEFFF